jgi:hypothetical protein
MAEVVMRLLSYVPLVALLGAGRILAGQEYAPGPVYPPLVRSTVASVGPQVGSTTFNLGPQEQPSRVGGCVLAQLSLGLAGLVLAGGGTAAVTDGAGPPLVAAGLGAVGGLMLGSYAGRCRASVLGAVGGAAVGVLIGATWGKAFADRRTEREDSQLAAGYVVMLPLSWLGAQLGK